MRSQTLTLLPPVAGELSVWTGNLSYQKQQRAGLTYRPALLSVHSTPPGVIQFE